MWPCAELCRDQTAKKLRGIVRRLTASAETACVAGYRPGLPRFTDSGRGELLGSSSPMSNELPPAPGAFSRDFAAGSAGTHGATTGSLTFRLDWRRTPCDRTRWLRLS